MMFLGILFAFSQNRLYREQREQHGIPPISQQTFYRARARFTTHEVLVKRKGARAAYVAQPFAWLDQTTPRHGERPFALAHLDHTELDLVLVSSVTGEALLSQQQRDLEGVSIREAIGGPSKTTSLLPSQVEVEPDEELDLGTLPHYEEHG